jgi:hypothetical protein
MEARLLEITRACLKEINALFVNDQYLSRTVPTRSYPIDNNKLNQWKALQCNTMAYNAVQDFKYQHIPFESWKKALAHAIAKLLRKAENVANHGFMVSNGRTLNMAPELLVNGLWITYIFRGVVSKLGYMVNDLNDYWFSVSKSSQILVEEIVFVEDFIRYGDRAAIRIFNTPSVNFKNKITILAAISLKLEFFRDAVYDLMLDISKNESLVNSILQNLDLVYGISFDIAQTEHILFDHTSSDTADIIVSYGYIYGVSNPKELRPLSHCVVNPESPIANSYHPNDLFLGSLIEGANPLSNELYPPPLYYLTFGNGKMPKANLRLKPAPGKPGFFVVDNEPPTSPTMKRTQLPVTLSKNPIELPKSRQAVTAPTTATKIVPPKGVSSSPSVEKWNDKDVEAFCDTWLEEEDYEDEEGINAFLKYALQKGIIKEETPPEAIGNLCKIFKTRQRAKPVKPKQLIALPKNPITPVRYKTAQEVEKEEMQKLVAERERQTKVRLVWDRITSLAYKTFLERNQMQKWDKYQELMFNLLNEEFLHPTLDYESRWQKLVPK